MAEAGTSPSNQRPSFWARQVRGLLLLLVVFAVGLAASSLPTWLGSYGEKAVVVALANLAAAAAVNVGLFLVALRVLTPQQIPNRQLVAGSLGRSCRPSVATWSATICAIPASCTGVFAIVLGLLFWLCLGAQLASYAAEVNIVAARRLWPRSLVQPLLTNADQRARVTQRTTGTPT
jgi:uncharacterized BrkB/YihY/UPF0761 family membrane protein